jgi:hypothetical protein
MGPNASTFSLVAANGKRAGDMLYQACLQLASVFVGNGPPASGDVKPAPAPAKKGAPPPASKPAEDGGQGGDGKVVVHGCHVGNYWNDSKGRPTWADTTRPEHFVQCGKKDEKVIVNGSPASVADFLLHSVAIHVAFQALKYYCGAKVTAESGAGRDEKQEKIGDTIMGPGSRTETYVEEIGDNVCVHAFFSWSSITCEDKKQFVCE